MSGTKGTAAAPRVPGVRKWTIGNVEVLQDELTFFEKNAFVGLVADALESMVARSSADVSSLITVAKEMRETGDRPSDVMDRLMEGDDDATEATTGVIRLILRLFGSAPDLLQNTYLIILSVPEQDWDAFRVNVFPQMSDDVGFGILDLFVKQNKQVLLDFGQRWWAQLSTLASETNLPTSVTSPVSKG